VAKELKLFGLLPRRVGLVKNIDRTTDSAALSDFGEDGVEQLDFDVELSDANVITSIAGDPTPFKRLKDVDEDMRRRYHYPVLDLDIPARLIPSSTSGHSHLYIDKLLSWSQYKELLTALANAGIIEDGYAGASIARGHTAVRLPWVTKGEPVPDSRFDVEPF
jgi:hypothetical protein